MTYLIKLFSLAFVLNFWSTGKLCYRSNHSTESLELLDNNTFTYQVSMHMGVKINSKGIYHIIKDTLYLNSVPALNRLVVKEYADKKVNGKTKLIVKRKKDNHTMWYHLYITYENNEKQVFRDQYEQTIIPGRKIREFYIIDTRGLKSPLYKIQDKRNTVFDIQFETGRFFENETWLIKGDSIIPRGFNGELQKYALVKAE